MRELVTVYGYGDMEILADTKRIDEPTDMECWNTADGHIIGYDDARGMYVHLGMV